MDRKNDAEVELARCRIESMQVNHDDDDDDDYYDDDDDHRGADEKSMSISTALATLELI